MFNLKNKLFFVTGATGFLGKAICEGLAKNNCSIAICSTSKDNAYQLSQYLNSSYHAKSKPYKLDVSNVKNVKQVKKRILEDFGKVDCLVNNAFFTGGCEFNNFSLSAFTKGLDGTINQVAYLTDLFTPELEKTQGSIVNIASMYGMVSPDPSIYNKRKVSFVDYGVGKSAIIHYTKYSAVQLAKKNIRVNSISPGAFPNYETRRDINFLKNLEKKIPMERIGNPEEISGSVLFLASGYASYITGHNLVVDGGWTIW